MSLTYHSLKRITGGAPIAGSTLWAASVTPRPRTIGLKSVLTGAAIFENGSEGLRVIPDLNQCRPNGILEVRRFLLRWRREMLKKTERNCKHVNIASDHESEKYSQITNQKNIPKNKRDLVDSKGWYLIYVMESTRGSEWSTTYHHTTTKSRQSSTLWSRRRKNWRVWGISTVVFFYWRIKIWG